MLRRLRKEPTPDPTMSVIAEATKRIAQRNLAESYAEGLSHGVEQAMLSLLGRLEGESAVGNFYGPVNVEVREWAEAVLSNARAVDRIDLVRRAVKKVH